MARRLLAALLLATFMAGQMPMAHAQEQVAILHDNGAPDLNAFLLLQRLICPSATVSAGFYDWRSVSKYRGTAGLHLGYDIAMPAGTAAVAGWPGQVTRIVDWYGPEFGITVLSPSGYEITYGHLSPRVKVGDVVNAGDTVGLVVNDHVDIKMRGPDGMYFDFGHSTPPAVGSFPMPAPVRPSRGDAMQMYQTAWYSLQLDKEELREAQNDELLATSALTDLRTRVRKSRADLPRLRQFLAEGLIARVDVEKAASDVQSGVAKVAELEARVRSAQQLTRSRRASMQSMQTQVDLAARVLASMGVSQSEMQRKLHAPTAPAAVAQARELQQARKRAHGTTAAPSTMAAARREADRMEQLYEQGVISRAERDQARARFDAVQHH